MSGLVALLVCLALFAGWRLRDLHLITPGSGTGYVLGILGTSMMLVLLLYSIRKRIPKVEHIGSVKRWFQSHMLLGVLGPTLVLFHTNFHLGALNSNVALLSMLIVVSSGVIGRYLYRKIHYGLYGHRTTLIELRRELEHEREEVGPLFALVPGLKEELFGFADGVLRPCATLSESLVRVFGVGWSAGWLGRKYRRMTRLSLARHAAQQHWSSAQQRRTIRNIQREIRRMLDQTVRVARFGFYERTFALWHLLHIPLVVMIVVTATIHILAVNRY